MIYTIPGVQEIPQSLRTTRPRAVEALKQAVPMRREWTGQEGLVSTSGLLLPTCLSTRCAGVAALL